MIGSPEELMKAFTKHYDNLHSETEAPQRGATVLNHLAEALSKVVSRRRSQKASKLRKMRPTCPHSRHSDSSNKLAPAGVLAAVGPRTHEQVKTP